MNYELDCSVKLSNESKYQSLYKWFLSEADPKTGIFDSPQVPWHWGVYFEAIDAEYTYNTEFRSENHDQDSGYEITINRSIRARLVSHRSDLGAADDVLYSFFGTHRPIEDIRLLITMLDDPSATERCHCWGSVSYTSEEDFRQVRSTDTLIFYLYIAQDAFSELLATIERGDRTKLYFNASGVHGLYSEWTPGISAQRIKVLANSDDQKVVPDAGCTVDPPKLGRIGHCGLSIIRSLA